LKLNFLNKFSKNNQVCNF